MFLIKAKSKLILALFIALCVSFMGVQETRSQALCPTVDFNPGVITAVVNPSVPVPDFTAGLLGTQEIYNGSVVAGIDWMYNEGGDEDEETNIPGAQLISPFNQTGGNASYLQVTNTAVQSFCRFSVNGPQPCTTDDQCSLQNTCEDGCTLSGEDCDNDLDCTQNLCVAPSVNVHVQFFNPSCGEIINFCDSYTPGDTHVYDLSNVTTNNGGISLPQVTTAIADQEGFMTVTATDTCNSTTVDPIGFEELVGNLRIINESDSEYGTNVYARTAEDFALVGECSDNGAPCIFEPFEDLSLCENPDMSSCITPDTELEAQCSELVGLPGCQFKQIVPDILAKDYNFQQGPVGSDLIFINFQDVYGALEYDIAPAFTTFDVDNIDENEFPISCGDTTVCYARYGVNQVLPISDDVDLDPTPDPEDCAVEGDEDEDGAADCADTDCDLADGCEGTTEGDCTDMMDNDGDGNVDCADGGCASDPACMMTGDGDGDGDGDGGGSGCSVASTSSAGTSAAGLLLPMMVFGLGIMVRRMRRK